MPEAQSQSCAAVKREAIRRASSGQRARCGAGTCLRCPGTTSTWVRTTIGMQTSASPRAASGRFASGRPSRPTL